MLQVYSSEHLQTDASAKLALHFFVKVIVKSTENKLLIIIRRIQQHGIFDGNNESCQHAQVMRNKNQCLQLCLDRPYFACSSRRASKVAHLIWYSNRKQRLFSQQKRLFLVILCIIKLHSSLSIFTRVITVFFLIQCGQKIIILAMLH